MASIKAVITNNDLLQTKYGQNGAGKIYTALGRMVAHDATRGITTQIFEIDNTAQMSAYNVTPMLGIKDERGAKDAVDAIYNALACDYIMLLDGPDVIPHIALNPIAGIPDGDPTIPSDLPYASPTTLVTRVAANYLNVTRVVGRLPACVGEKSEDVLIGLIDKSISHTSMDPADFTPFFAISADDWKISSQLSLKAVFGNIAGLFLSGPSTHNAIDPSLGFKSHFINCHGNSGDFRFYGEKAKVFSDAMDSSKIPAGTISPGAVAVAECCFGAQLYNYNLLVRSKPICMNYLTDGAAAFLGSTNVSYGPASSTGQADLICQLFLQKILAGASSGRALLQARQDFILTQLMSTATNLKTIAQFILLGDPSLHPVAGTVESVEGAVAIPKVMPIPADATSERKSRRVALASQGASIASAASRPGRRLKTTSPAVERFAEIAREEGMADVEVFSVTGGPAFRAAKKAMDGDRKVVVASKEIVHGAKDDFDQNFVTYQVMIGHIIDDGLFEIEECESR
jgi:hypothetical protein